MVTEQTAHFTQYNRAETRRLKGTANCGHRLPVILAIHTWRRRGARAPRSHWSIRLVLCIAFHVRTVTKRVRVLPTYHYRN